jgi:diguanylate cyclase (GGDEF)-like protein
MTKLSWLKTNSDSNKKSFGAFIFSLIVCFITISLFSPDLNAAVSKNALIVNSYHHGYKWTDDEMDGIISALDPKKNNIQVYVEYMGAKWASGDQYFLQLAQTLKDKYKAVSFDVIIASDNEAVEFLKKYRDAMFGMSPVVFCGVNDVRIDDIKGLTYYTGVNETPDIRGTLDLALKLHSNTKKIYVISDASAPGKRVQSDIEVIKLDYKTKAQFDFIDDTDMAKVLAAVERIPSDSLILYAVFTRDYTGKFFEHDEGLPLIAAKAKVPIYGLWDSHLGFGIVGGKLLNGFDQGKAAGEIAANIILKGTNIGGIPVVMSSPTRYMFDYKQMDRFGVSTSQLPKDSVVMNKPPDVYRVSAWLVIGIIVVLVLMAGSVLMLLIGARQRKSAQESLKKAHDDMEKRVQERTTELSKANQMLRNEISQRREVQEKLQEFSEKDPLTKLYNKQRFTELMWSEIKRARQDKISLAAIRFDIDNFDMINSTYGRGAGDAVLKTIADVVRYIIGKNDIFAKYGEGGELVIISSEKDINAALTIAEKIRKAVDQYNFSGTGKVTVSAGVTELVQEDTENSFMKRTEEVLAVVKSQGGNKVEAAKA